MRAVALSKTYTRYSIEESSKLTISCIIFLNATAPLQITLFVKYWENCDRT